MKKYNRTSQILDNRLLSLKIEMEKVKTSISQTPVDSKEYQELQSYFARLCSEYDYLSDCVKTVSKGW